MRILMDAHWWERGPHANRTVQREVILAWARAFPEDELVLAMPADAADDAPPRAAVARTRLWPHAAANRWELPRIARRTGADVVLAHNFTPASGRALTFLHDVMFEEHPEWFSRAERLYFGRMLPWASRAAAVATSTRSEAERIRRHAPRLPPAAVTGLGVPPSLTGAARRPGAVPETARFAVTVGRLNVRKNLETAMLAASRSARITPAAPLCVVGGSEHSGIGARIPDEARARIADGSIVMLGHVPDEELGWLYRHAALTLCLSLDEGFGMPAVEAAALGSPLLASDIPVFRETVGGCATLVSPLDADAVARAIDLMWGVAPDAGARERAVGGYTWEAAARALRASAAEVVSRRGRQDRR
ncbi:glycosyltransferase family 1 protein [Agrococcus sp. HG114]|uniref:glycosyltransferase family 4 protein n=1 Tax=Agrococcus sp. HG114 TaxID=2969757 RepID=UPI00215A22A8|nr:glycosyltransferase family 1 protein [Agrococcus sp. HG114]MCR8672015.1 glycosyltransferase family 4 protein [Agrococcus sp. HG114]